MIKYLPIILLCNGNVARTDCNKNNPEVTVSQGQIQNTIMSCLMEGQTRIAGTAIAPKPEDNMYVLIRCEPKQVSD